MPEEKEVVHKAPEGVDIKIWRREVKYKDKQSDFLVVVLMYNTPLLYIVTEDEIILMNATNFAHNGRSKILLYSKKDEDPHRFQFTRNFVLTPFILYAQTTDPVFKNIPKEPYTQEPEAYKNKEIYQGILRKECGLIAPFLGKNRERRMGEKAAQKRMKHLKYIEAKVKNSGI